MPFHKHRWVALGAQLMMEDIFNNRTMQKFDVAPKPVTEVLQRCADRSCASLRTTSLDGHWTLEQIRGEA